LRSVKPFITVNAPLRRDAERRRWYSDGAETCVVLSERGRLLEPFPTFGPQVYRLLARQVSFCEADDYARRLGLAHLRSFERLPRGA
jgi:hypothetical protein